MIDSVTSLKLGYGLDIIVQVFRGRRPACMSREKQKRYTISSGFVYCVTYPLHQALLELVSYVITILQGLQEV